MNRRSLIVGVTLAVLAKSRLGRAQQADRPRRIGYLGLNSLPEVQHLLETFRLGLRHHGWNEGANVVIEYRFAHGKPDRLLELAGELVRAQVDVIVTPVDTTILAAKRATATIPIVMVASGDPVGTGLVASLARPGGNVTGLSSFAADLGGKRLELLREAVPRLSRVAVLWNADNLAKARELAETQVAARSLRVTLQSLPLRGPAPDFHGAFATLSVERAQAAVVLGDAFTFRHRAEIAERATANRVPTMWEGNIFMDAGGLMSYGPDLRDQFRRAAGYVDKIFKGSKPADLPVEQPNTFELIINLKAAKALGLTISPSLLSRADKVIE